MKAAVIYAQGEMPQYVDIPEPVVQPGEVLVTVKAVALKHFDRSREKGTHYSSAGHGASAARVIGGDGVCVMPDGSRVYAIGASGMMALGGDGGSGPGDEPKHGGGGLTSSDGGFTHGGGGLTSGDEAFVERLRLIHRATPINVIVDYLWGHSAELILAALKGKGGFSPRTRFVSVGAVTGDEIRLSAALLRSVDLQLSGSGLGSWTKKQVGLLFTEILPQFFRLAEEGKLVVDTVPVNLRDIGGIWAMEVPDGKRLVVRL